MPKRQSLGPTSILVTITFIMMVTVNALANILPIAGITTGAVSDSYPNLFAPAGITFTIWGLIYLLLALYTLYQLGLFRGKDDDKAEKELLKQVGNLFAFSSIINSIWIFCWHNRVIFLSFVLMLLILISLMAIYQLIRKATLTKRQWLFISLPFSVYFGWITVATIANATTLLVDLGWGGWAISEAGWTATMLIIGTLIGMATAITAKDIPYAATLIWAFVGILIKHRSADGFKGAYPMVLITVQLCLLALAGTVVLIIFMKRKNVQ
ncbi:tryptophan-rich sensory protein [Sphaerochaeta sp. PS]|uniref:tryptophan-rich sensory protein n=1 Tax=Sphaerochaeta sp. PS TaxID=3076336 RepID=UPI0028A43336|nr:tryptophan-rich sensory protein [Sphaerochaeta sp. PS]MDT4762092.1 tryptophan-rich sensory protein [Sphaerochaeta sp. PS]